MELEWSLITIVGGKFQNFTKPFILKEIRLKVLRVGERILTHSGTILQHDRHIRNIQNYCDKSNPYIKKHIIQMSAILLVPLISYSADQIPQNNANLLPKNEEIGLLFSCQFSQHLWYMKRLKFLIGSRIQFNMDRSICSHCQCSSQCLLSLHQCHCLLAVKNTAS